MRKAILSAAVVFACISTPLSAHDSNSLSFDSDSCEVSIEHDVSVNSEFVRVFDGDRTLYKMTTDGELWVGDEEIDLTDKQKTLGQEYVANLQELVPKVVTLVSDTLEITGKSLEAAFNGMLGEDNKVGTSIQKAMADAQARFDEAVTQNGDETTLSNKGFDGIEEAFGEEFEASIEEAVQDSIGAMIMMVGKAIIMGEEGFEERMEDFGDKMERDMEKMAEGIEQRSEQLCTEFDRARDLEDELQAGIPQLAKLGLFED